MSPGALPGGSTRTLTALLSILAAAACRAASEAGVLQYGSGVRTCMRGGQLLGTSSRLPLVTAARICSELMPAHAGLPLISSHSSCGSDGREGRTQRVVAVHACRWKGPGFRAGARQLPGAGKVAAQSGGRGIKAAQQGSGMHRYCTV